MSSLALWDRGNSASLFDRIRDEEPGIQPAQEMDRLVCSVKRQLERVLNTRRGSCRSAPELGVVDLNDPTESSADTGGRIREVIRHCIREYEPRIVDVEVFAVDNPTSAPGMTFRVNASVHLDTFEQVASFDIHMDSNRHYRMM
ncbi:TPA: type VI secretion system baseplate subunit TssE [Serratia marcescens]|uniref:Type VI secretion system baseplate subunit TssE n=1 Tax=Serratia ureilytica TaxID=300181 RepID=A0A9X9BXA6_9GAMM|nr:type VI secretion system baseplate subunit TssE [Serratia ureilytica]MBS3894569.1 type VI secretion system baseplate subunit TssE [Serratia marcescens]TXE21959.1 type VI secretion system baseplate subunit TssE [Serratia ureilytica]HBC7422214.1 type VI secretion system baseplate subunit TssE [Serratia marcescens]